MEEPRQRGELAEASPLFHKENDKKLRNEENFVEYLTSPFFLVQSGASSFLVVWVSNTTRSKCLDLLHALDPPFRFWLQSRQEWMKRSLFPSPKRSPFI